MVADRAALGPDRTELLRAPVPGEFPYDPRRARSCW
jgi:hypothetical protein